jgi:hypothetical protein
MLFALGFLFLFTIGGLNYLLVLLLKITKCWKLLLFTLIYYKWIYIILLLFLVKIYYYKLSAGNVIKNITLETICNPYNILIIIY